MTNPHRSESFFVYNDSISLNSNLIPLLYNDPLVTYCTSKQHTLTNLIPIVIYDIHIHLIEFFYHLPLMFYCKLINYCVNCEH